MYVLTQFNTTSLHQHIAASYKFDNLSTTRSFVEVLAAQQTQENVEWYQGTADAVRQNLRYFLEHPAQYFVILSGDQLYHMDYRDLLRQHVDSGADITLGTVPVARREASEFGIMHSHPDRRIFRFQEKPKDPAMLDDLKIPAPLLKEMGRRPTRNCSRRAWASTCSTGRCSSTRSNNDLADFGKHIIPAAIEKHRVHAYIFQGYWEDIGTIRAFFEANLALTDIIPPYSFFDREAPIYTRARFLPASKINSVTIRNAVISDGCIISDARLERCVVGVRSVVNSGAELRDVVLMGADYYEGDPRGLDPRAARQCPGHRHRAQLRHQTRDHRQKRAHRRRRGDHPRGQAGQLRQREFLHPRRHRGRAEKRRDPGGKLGVKSQRWPNQPYTDR